MISTAQKLELDHVAELDAPLEVPAPETSAKVRVPKPVNKAPSAFRTISEVAETLNVQQHVLRFWETKFSQIRPLKRGGGRRYYRPEDVSLITRIHHLLYTEGYTIKGVQKLLKGQGVKQAVAAPAVSETAVASVAAPIGNIVATSDALAALPDSARIALRGLLQDLKALRGMVRG